MRRLALATAVSAMALGLGGAGAPAPIQLALPIDCTPGRDCLVQNYTDHDPTPGRRDFACGPLTYDHHQGTDFRIPDMAAQRRGVKVLAAAAGTVLRTRDGVDDISFRDRPAPVPSNRACGNGLIIQHPGGWQTQYCHMARGSVRVHEGDKVAVGTVLGLVGLSGQTEFPHLHLSVREGKQDVDPFAYGAAPGQCNAGRSLWRPELQAMLRYRPRSVLNAGFTDMQLTMPQLEQGNLRAPGPGSDAVVAYVRAIGLRTGDVQQLVVRGPKGETVAQQTSPALDRDKAQQLVFAGARAHGRWRPGRYTAEYKVLNGGAVVLTNGFAINFQ